jgi:hypothetical protein
MQIRSTYRKGQAGISRVEQGRQWRRSGDWQGQAIGTGVSRGRCGSRTQGKRCRAWHNRRDRGRKAQRQLGTAGNSDRQRRRSGPRYPGAGTGNWRRDVWGSDLRPGKPALRTGSARQDCWECSGLEQAPAAQSTVRTPRAASGRWRDALGSGSMPGQALRARSRTLHRVRHVTRAGPQARLR